jgi:hypothetical protein
MNVSVETSFRPSLWCSLFGHKWIAGEWEPAERPNGEKVWRLQQTCKRCGSFQATSTNTLRKPLNVVFK